MIMNKLDRIKNVLDNEVLEYLNSEEPNREHVDVETNICFEEDVEYDARVRIKADFRYIRDYITDEYGNKHDESYWDLKNYEFDIIDLIDIDNDCYIIEDGEEVKH